MTLGDRIKEMRENNRWMQKDLAAKLHVTPSAISSWERDRTEPNIGIIMEMAEIFHCDAEDIIGCEKSKPNSFVLETDEAILVEKYRAISDDKKFETLMKCIEIFKEMR